MKQSETKKNITDIIKEYSLETGIPETFIEKDIYVLKVLSVLTKISYPDVKIIFSGGTCLSKAYNKIKRFSEDIDFCIQTSKPFTRKERSAFRKLIITAINDCDDLKVLESPITITDESSFFSFEIEYNKAFETYENLRKNIKAEFKFENVELPCKKCEIKSMIHPYIDDKSVDIDCINVVEVAANKFSALLWRCFVKDRSQPLYSKENDPTIMRHLYDLAVLEAEIKVSKFVDLANKLFLKDKNRATNAEFNLNTFAKLIYDKLASDKIFKNEYQQFVESMCYSSDTVSFETALNSLKNIIEHISTYP